MRIFKSFLLALLFIVFACEEQPVDTEPSPESSSIKLTRVEQIIAASGDTFVTDYVYENELLLTATTEGLVTSYFYDEGILVRKVTESNDGWTTTNTYAYEENKLIMRTEYRGPSDSYSLTENEYIMESEHQMRINIFRVDGLERNFQGHNICALENGNVTSEIPYDSQGNPHGHSVRSEFGTVLNPDALFKGHPQILSTNLAHKRETYLQNELSSTSYLLDIQINEDNLPTQFVMKSDSTGEVLSTSRFFYEK